jgi:hypothetical protein
LIVWEANYSRKAVTIQEAYPSLKKDAQIIRTYLEKKGINPASIVFSSVNIEKEYEYVQNPDGSQRSYFKGYILSQKVQIESKEVNKVEEISREVTELIDSGIELRSNSPDYYYTKLAALKIEMLASATADARERAEKIAENAGAEIGDLKSAEMGIFQITAQNSNEDYSWGGAYNTTSKRKTASITIRLQFLLD